ncbi:UPF0653 protein C607.02c [Manduca sexta]|uniref:UPF0653 protein C607.02c n=1 Tax=Manduca sexta TaxID=7130 RepID=UPI001183DED2|nr:UPF0653 protein C607.02c [Manduca sexta]
MGRKIPAKKHRGVKDPLVQQARRLQSLKSKINAPPNDPDDQPVPRSLTRLFEFQNKHKEDKTHKKKKPLKRLEHAKGHNKNDKASDNPVSRLRKLPGETGRDFSLRINSAMKALHNPTEQLDYPQDLMEEEDEKGARMAAQRERRARKRRRAHAHTDSADPLPTRAQRLAAKKLHNKQKALEAQQEKREVVYERVPFGEVCSAPPALRPHKRRAQAQGPARRGLLLSAMLGDTGAPAAEALRRERARLDAVAAYRALRAHRALRAAPHQRGDTSH